LKKIDSDTLFGYKVVVAGPKWNQKTLTIYVKDSYKGLLDNIDNDSESPLHGGKVIVVPDSTVLK
jgi:hypothetical protein